MALCARIVRELKADDVCFAMKDRSTGLWIKMADAEVKLKTFRACRELVSRSLDNDNE